MFGLVERGWQVSCITQREFKTKNITVIRLPKINNYLKYSQAISSVLRDIKPDIAECSNWRAELIDFSRNKRHLNTQLIVRSDPSSRTLFGDVHFFKAEKELCQNADKVLAVSKFAQKDIQEKYHLDNVRVIYNAIDDNYLSNIGVRNKLSSGFFIKKGKRFFPKNISSFLAKDRFNIFWCGKPNAMKGFDYLEKIVLAAPKEFAFVINIGRSSHRILWSLKALKKASFIWDLDKIDQVNILRQCKAFLSTSRVEGFGLALLEALVLGLPAVANNYCEVYHEFLPSTRLFLVDITNVNLVLDYLLKLAAYKKQNGLDLRKLPFTKAKLIYETEQIYRELLNI